VLFTQNYPKGSKKTHEEQQIAAASRVFEYKLPLEG
jgi:hypothetical protein